MVQSLKAPLDSTEHHQTGCRHCQGVYVGDHLPAVHNIYLLVETLMMDKSLAAPRPGQHMIMVENNQLSR